MTKTPLIIISIAAVSFAVTFVVLYAFVLQPFMAIDDDGFQTPGPFQTLSPQPTTTNPTLSAARDLEGTWKTSFATKFNIQIDGEDVGYENRAMTWVITKTSQENVFNVKVTFTSAGRELVAGSGYTPDVSPMFLIGTVSGTRLTLESASKFYVEPVGEFNFTTDIITGTWHDHWEIVYNQNVYTATNGLTLARQW